MEKKRRRFYFIPMIIISILLAGAAVMLLWNAILPDLLNWRSITYGQALGLLILCRILFSPMRPGPRAFKRGGPPWRSKFMDLSDEEREKLREEWRRRTGGRSC